MKKILLLAFFLPAVVFAQDYPLTDSLKQNLANAKTPAAKVLWLGKLSSFYRTLNKSLCEQYAKEQMQVAELSRDRTVMLEALLSQAHSCFNAGGIQENMMKGKKFSQQALDLAKSSHMAEYESWGYIYMARGARNEGENEKALNYNALALAIATTTNNDSLKISAYNSLANTYLARKEKLLAFRNYLQALNLAEGLNNFEQTKNCYQNLAGFYRGLEEYEKAKDYQFKIFALTKKYHKPYDRLELYNDLGDTYAQSKNYEMATEFYDKALKLADSVGFGIFRINSYSRIIDMYFNSNQASKALAYINEKKELRDFMHQAGVDFYLDHGYGIAYLETGKYDSAFARLKRAQAGFETRANKFNQYYFYQNFASYFKYTGNYNKALEYMLKAKKISDDRGDIQLQSNIASKLDTLYQKLGDFKSAYAYNAQYHQLKDSLQTLEAEKDLLALEVDNENQHKAREARALEEATRQRHNIQYMGITVLIASVFIVLVMMGAFSVSKTTIRVLGFFAFIFLFEFIILLADHQIHDFTHGEPWKVLAIKIVLISLLLPLHHFLEEKVIHLLTERKLLEGSAQQVLAKFRGKSETV